MLTNCHTLVLRELLERHPEMPHAGEDAYVYNVAPDSLPLSGEFKARETHRFTPPAGIMGRFPKLLWVKCHLVVDNICHYGSIAKVGGGLSPSQKRGYTYLKGVELIPLMREFTKEMGVSADESTLHYLAHVLVEIAVDYAIHLDDGTVGEQLRDAQNAMSDAQKREYAEGLGALYGCKPEKVARARGAPRKFYGDMHDVDQLFVGGRTKIVLRKLRLPFNEENTEKTCRLIEEGARMTGDYMEFIDESVDALSDWEAWEGEVAIDGMIS
ncbi:MAG: hypothetical protein OXE44_09185 [Nitrospinae bacterium]|nr:hypothetical protein [Nitrospinota bacterium]